MTEKKQPRQGGSLVWLRSIFSSGEITEDTGCERGKDEETEGREEIEEDGIPP